MKTLIFDYDGTLHDCLKIYQPAFLKMYEQLVVDGYAQAKKFTADEISQWLGMTAGEMWESFMPALSAKEKQKYSRMIGQEMDRLIAEQKAELYPESLAVLRELKDAGYHLIFLSNCRHDYMEAHKAQFGLEDYFTAFYCAEDFGWQPKYEIFKTISKEYPGEFVAIGDRYHDLALAKENELPSVGCLYGYGRAGELSAATAQISSLTELSAALEKL